MKSFSIVTTVAATLALAAPAHAQFGMPKMPGLPGGASSAPSASVDVDGFLVNAHDAERLVSHSATLILLAIGTDEQIKTVQDGLAAAKAIQDPKEREAAVQKVEGDALVQTSKLDFEERSKATSSALSDQKRTQLGDAMFNLALGMLKDRELYGQGQTIISNTTSNPLAAARMTTKLVQIKDSVGLLGKQVSYTPTIMGGLTKLMSVAKVQQLPTSTSEKPHAVEL